MQVFEIIAKYWIEFLLGIIGTVILTNFKKIKIKLKEWKIMKEKEKDNKFKTNLIDTIKPMLNDMQQKSDQNDIELRQELENLEISLENVANKVEKVTEGVLSVQGNIFKSECRDILEQEEPVTEVQYIKCMKDHTVYNSLGGNSDGDQLFELVTEIYKHDLTKKGSE